MTPAIAALNKEIEELRDRERRLHSAIVDIARAAARVLPTPLAYRCVWCEATLDGLEATREHVANCDQHPAVVKLREAQAGKLKPPEAQAGKLKPPEAREGKRRRPR